MAAAGIVAALSPWTQLTRSHQQGLTSLRLELPVNVDDMYEVWPELGALTQLRSLQVVGVHAAELRGVLGLADCCYLTALEVSGYSQYDKIEMYLSMESEVSSPGPKGPNQ
jgi:hypothetical protein